MDQPKTAYGTFQENSTSTVCNIEPNEVQNEKPKIPPRFKVNRTAMSQAKLDAIAPPFREENTFPEKMQYLFLSRMAFSCACFANFMKRIFPVLRWIPEYSIKNDLLVDVITGFTLLILHVPQGMAYAQLAAVPPNYGLYTSFYPVLVYFFLGTSRHVSIGTFAVSSLLTGNEVTLVSHDEHQKAAMDAANFTLNTTMRYVSTTPVMIHDKIQIAMMITFIVGILQTAMGLLRMGSLTSFMSDEMVSAFITGTTIHVFTSQIASLTGGKFRKFAGPFNIIRAWIELFGRIDTVNYFVLLISLGSLTFLILVKEVINVFLLPRIKVPIPAELILVIVGTLLSQHFDIHSNFSVDIVGPTSSSLEGPVNLPFELFPQVFPSSLVLAVVCATTTLSMVLIYAKKHEYEVDTNQELVAYGVGGIISSFFFCIPSCGSLSRSAVQETMGAKSQISSLVSCALMLIVILFLGGIFEHLPNCILSAIIIMSLKSMLLHFGDFKRAWNTSKLDACIWMVTFLSVVILDMDYGLIIGILFSLITILFRSQYPETCLMGNVQGTELYRSSDKYPNVAEIPGIKIYHFGASLYFGNRDHFRSQIFHLVSSQQSASKMPQIRYQNSVPHKQVEPVDQLSVSSSFKEADLLQVIIIELSAVAYIDSGGVATLVQVIKEFALNNIVIYIACVQEPVLESLRNQGFFKTFSEEYVFPTIHDAVLYAKEHKSNS